MTPKRNSDPIWHYKKIQKRRDEIAKDAKQSLKEYRAGDYTPLTVHEAISRLGSLS